MPDASPKGIGRRRPLLDIRTDHLHLDPNNPRLPEEVQGSKEPVLLRHLLDHFDLDELAASMSSNGYFDEEPVVVIPRGLPKRLIPKDGQTSAEYKEFIQRKDTEFDVVEGNRRLAAAKLLLSEELRKENKA